MGRFEVRFAPTVRDGLSFFARRRTVVDMRLDDGMAST
jgi:hypothetical protein